MSKKMKSAPMTETTTETTTDTAPVALPPTTQDATPEAVVPTFAVIVPDFTPGRGFATEVFKVVQQQPMTAQQVADAMLASGAYQQVAPRAAELRPLRPVTTVLKQWAAQGVVEVR